MPVLPLGHRHIEGFFRYLRRLSVFRPYDLCREVSHLVRLNPQPLRKRHHGAGVNRCLRPGLLEVELTLPLVEKSRPLILVDKTSRVLILLRPNLLRTAPKRPAEGRTHDRAYRQVHAVQVVLLSQLVVILMFKDEFDTLDFSHVRPGVRCSAVGRGHPAARTENRRKSHTDCVHPERHQAGIDSRVAVYALIHQAIRLIDAHVSAESQCAAGDAARQTVTNCLRKRLEKPVDNLRSRTHRFGIDLEVNLVVVANIPGVLIHDGLLPLPPGAGFVRTHAG